MTRWRAAALGLALLASPLVADAQRTAKLPRVGFLAGSTAHPSPRTNAFVAGLRDYGYIDGKNISIEWRPSVGHAERVAEHVAELLRLEVDVIVALDNPSIAAAQKATSKIPIVMVLATDPVAMGFVASLARPGGNITGLTNRVGELQGKMLQLLKQTLPAASRVVVLWNPAERGREADAKEAQTAARGLGFQARLAGAVTADEYDRIFATFSRERPDAVLIQPSTVSFFNRVHIAQLATKGRVPTIGWTAETAEA